MAKKGRDSKGNPVNLHKHCIIKIYHTAVHPKPAVAIVHPPRGKWFGPEELGLLRDEWIDKVDKQFPQWEFRLVEIRENQFNFIYAKDRDVAKVAPASPSEDIRQAADISLDTAPHLAYKTDAETVPSKIIKP